MKAFLFFRIGKKKIFFFFFSECLSVFWYGGGMMLQFNLDILLTNLFSGITAST